MITMAENGLDYPFLLSVGTFLLAKELTALESNKTSKQKKERVLAKKRDMLCEAFPERSAEFIIRSDDFIIERLEAALKIEWPKDQAFIFVIDLAFTNPFAPYELAFTTKHFGQALKKVGLLVGLESTDVDRIQHTQKDAVKVHKQLTWGKIAVFGIGGMILLGVGGWLIAPIIGGAIGAAAGLYGAAATSHGLAILGGGSLAIGGMGMAGGMWVVASTGATMGLLSAGGVPLLLELGATRVRIELIKLQVSYKEVILGTQTELKKAQEVIKSLGEKRDELKQQLEEERKLNDKNANRLKDIEATLEALEQTLKWMDNARAQVQREQSDNGKNSGRQLKSGE